MGTASSNSGATVTAYDAAGNVTAQINYASTWTAAQVEALGNDPTLAGLEASIVPSQNDMATLTVYDAEERPVAVVAPEYAYNSSTRTWGYFGQVTTTTYGVSGQVVATQQYSQILIGPEWAALGLAPTLAQVQNMLALAGGSAQLTIYDGQNQPVATIVGSGVVTTTAYDSSGRVISTRQYATALTASQRSSLELSPTLVTLQAFLSPSQNDRTSLTIYDDQGRVLASVDPYGNTTINTYDAAGSLISATSYGTPLTEAQRLALGSSPTVAALETALGSSSFTRTLTIYDAEKRVVGSVSSNESVTLTTYDAAGNIATTTNYGTALTSAQIASLGTTPTLAALQADLSPASHDAVSLTVYDADERPIVTLSNNKVTFTTYDASGNVIATVSRSESLTPQQVEGLGGNPTLRNLQSLLALADDSQTQLSIYDANNHAVATIDNGVVTTNVYDADGQITASTVYATALTDPQIVALEANPTLSTLQTLLSPGASDQTSLTIYDANGRVVATVGSGGVVSVITRDDAGNPRASTQYATPLTAAQVAALGTLPTLAALQADLTPSSADQTSLAIYDSSNRVVATVSSAGVAALTNYDASGNPTSVTQYATALTSSQMTALGMSPTLAALQADLTPSAADQTSLAIYDANNHVVATVSGTGAATVTTYDAAGNPTAVTQYATPLTAAQLSALGASPTLAALQADLTPSTADQTSLTIYDANERVVATVGADGTVITTAYGSAGLPSLTRQYLAKLSAQQVAALGSAPTLSALQADLDPQSGDTITALLYDTSNRLVASVSNGLLTTTAYDDAGNISAVCSLSLASLGLGASDIGQMAGSLTLAGVQTLESLATNPQTTLTIYDSSNQPVATIANGAVTTMTYDAAGNVTATTQYATVLGVAQQVALGDAPTLVTLQSLLTTSTGDKTSLTVYDDQGRPVAAVAAPQSIYDPVSGTYVYGSQVTITTYDSAGDATATTQYASLLTTAQVAALGTAPTLANVQADLDPDAGYLTTLAVYDANHRVVAQVGTDGSVTTTSYDSAGNVVAQIQYANKLSTTQMDALGNTPTLAALQADLVPSSNDQTTLTIYDSQERVVATVVQVTPFGFVDGDFYQFYSSEYTEQATITDYDAAGRATTVTSYGVSLTSEQIANLVSNPTLATLQSYLSSSAETGVTVNAYDANGNLVAWVNTVDTPDWGEGYTVQEQLTTASYDASGNRIGTQTYTNNVSISDVAGLGASPTLDQLVAVFTTNSLQETIYDADDRPVATISNGHVTTTTYDDSDRVLATTAYGTVLTVGQQVSLGATPTLSELMACLTPGPDDQTNLTIYDAQGNPVAAVSPVWNDDPTSGWGYSGRVVLQSFDSAGDMTASRRYATLLTPSQMESLGSTPTLAQLEAMLTPSSGDRTRLSVYDADGRIVGEVSATGVVTLNSYDSSGDLTATTQYATPLAAAQIEALGTAPALRALQAAVVPSPADLTSLSVYDADGRIVGSVDTSGHVTITAYDDSGRVLAMTRYTTAMTAAQMAALGSAPTLAALQAAVSRGEGDSTTLTIYDANGRVVGTVNAAGDATTTTYDANGNVTAVTQYAAPLTWQQAEAVAASPTLATLQGILGQGASNHTSLTIYDANGDTVATVAADGTVNMWAYDAAGKQTATTRYATRLTSAQILALGDTPTLAALQTVVTPSLADRTTLTVYDANEQVVGTVDSAGDVSITDYDAAGNVVETVQYATPLSRMQIQTLGTTPTLAMLQADLGIADGAGTSQFLYDDNGRVIANISADGHVTTTTYDDAGNVTATTSYATPLPAQHGYISDLSQLLAEVQTSAADITTHTIYDSQNRPIANVDATGHVTLTTYDAAGNVASVVQGTTVLTPTQMAALGNAPTMAALQAMLTPTHRAIYDAANRPIASIDADGDVSYSFYNEAGELAATVDPTGAVTAYSYDADGRVIQATCYATLIDTSGWMSDGTLTSGFPGELTLPRASSADRTTQTIYDAVGDVVATIDAGGSVVTTSYDVEGDAVSSTAYARRLTAAQRKTLGVAPSLAELQAVLTTSAGDRTTQAIYDADGRMVATIDASGYVKTTAYDGDGHAVRSTAYATALTAAQRTALGDTPTLADLQADLAASDSDQTTRDYYNGQGRLVAQIDADGYLTVMAYNNAADAVVTTRYAVALTSTQLLTLTGKESTGALVRLLGTSLASEVTRSFYDAYGQLVRQVAVDGTNTTYAYDGDGNLIGTTTRPVAGQGVVHATSATYDAFGHMLTSKDATGAITTYTYDAQGRRTESTDALGNSTWYYYDADGRLLYAIQGEPGAGGIRNAWGNVTAHAYDAFGEVVSTTAYATPLNLDSAAGSAATLDPVGATLADVQAAVAALSASSSDANEVTTAVYTADGQVAKMTDGDGYVTTNSYDAFGDLVRVEQQLNQPGQALSATNSTTTRYGYDARGEQTIEIDGVGSSAARTTRTAYDAFGRVVRATDGNGNTTTYGYDGLGRQIGSSRAVQGVTRAIATSYDAFDQVLSTTDALGNVTTYQYNLATHTTTVTTPDGVVTTTVKDAYGDTLSVADGAGNATSYSYDKDGRLLSTTDTLGNVSTNAYNVDGELIRAVDADGVLVVYTYDASGRVLTRRVDPSGLNRITRYAYDGEGRLLDMTDSAGVVTRYAYDANGNQLTVSQDAGTGTGKLNSTTAYTYDGNGHVLTMTTAPDTSAQTTTQYTYDALGRLVRQVVDPAGLALVTGYAYDANGNLVQRTDADGNSIYTIYNQANEAVYTITPAGASGAHQGALTQNWYDADGRLVASRSYAALVDTSSLASLASQRPQANMASVAALAKSAGGIGAATAYRMYDADGRLQYNIDPLGHVTETRYNALGQVAETLAYATPIAVSFTLAKSLRTGGAQVSDLQQALVAAGESDATARVSYAYYDADGRQVYGITLNLVDGVLGAVVSQAQYDADGRVVADITYGVPLPTAAVGGSATTESIALALAQVNTLATTRTTQYIYDTAGAKVAQVDPNGNASYTFYDKDGRVVATVDPSGAVVQYTRDALGRVIRQTSYANTLDTAGWLDNGRVTVTLSQIAPEADPLDDRVTLTTYDAVGRVATVTRYSQAADGQYYDSSTGRWVDEEGYVGGDKLTYTYDSASRVIQTTDVGFYTYDINIITPEVVEVDESPASDPTHGTVSSTRTARYFYDADGNTIATLDADGYLTTKSYDAAGHVVQTEAYANATNATLRSSGTLGQLVPSTNPADQVASNFYDARGNLVGALDADGYFTQYTYDRDNQLLDTTRYAEAVGSETATSFDAITATLAGTAAEQTIDRYDAYGDLVSQRNAEGTVTQYAYDNAGCVTQTTIAAGTADPRTTSAAYDAFGDMVSSTDGLGHMTTHTYDLAGHKASTTDALGNTTWYVYDPNGRLVYTIRGMADDTGALNVLGEVSETDYDTFGDAVKTGTYAGRIDVGAGFAPTLQSVASAVTSIAVGDTYDNNVDQDGFTSFHYDLEGHVDAKVDGNNNEIDYTYDGFGDVALSEEESGNYNDPGLITRYTYDALGHMTSELDETAFMQSSGEAVYAARVASSGSNDNGPLFQILRTQDWAYDAFGNMVNYTDGNGAATDYGYDRLGHRINQSLVVQGQLRESSTAYDAYGRVLSTTDAMGLVTTYGYDDAKRTLTVTAPGGVITVTTHNREGQTIAVTDPAGNTTRYQYDADGHLQQTVNPDDSVVTDQYDAVGNLVQATDADGNVVAYVYDAAGRVLTQTVDPHGLALVTTYVYDGRGLKVSVTDPMGAVTTYANDGNGNVSEMIEGAGTAATDLNIKTDYDYNNRNEVRESDLYEREGSYYDYDGENDYEYDALGRLTYERTDTGRSESTRYAFDADGNVLAKTDGNGNSTFYQYNEAGEEICAIAPTGAVTQTWYNADGKITATRQYARALPLPYVPDLNDTWRQLPSAGQLEAVIGKAVAKVRPSPNDPVAYQVYGTNGRLQYSIDPTGAVTESRYNAAGQVEETLAYAHVIQIPVALATAFLDGTASTSDIQAALAAARNSDTNARRTFTYYDDRGRVRYTIASASVDGKNGGSVSETQYDADGNVLAQIQYGSLIPWGRVGGKATTRSIGNYLATLTANRATRYAYDAAGRQVYAVDAGGDVTETRYDDDGRVTWTLQYANAIAAPASWDASDIAAAVQAANPDTSTVRGTGNVYDAAGNVIQVFDKSSANPVATYAYDARGLKTSYTNRDGQTWTYQYDSDGNLYSQTSPDVTVAIYDDGGAYAGTTQQSIETDYEYDGSGNLVTERDAYNSGQSRTIQYVYDASNNLVRTIRPDPGSVGYRAVLTDTGTIPTTNTVYNALGQAVISTDANGNSSYQVYDRDGRLAYSIDADGYVTGYRYNTYGEQTAVTRYDSAIDTSVLTNWSPGEPLTLQQVHAALVTSTSDRTITTIYDAQGNKLSVTQPAIAYTNSDGSTATGSPVTRFTYDAYGNATSQSTLVQGTPGQADAVWATTFNYYDAVGHQVMTVDPMGYVTTSAYDSFGDVTSITEWATPVSTSGLVAGGAPPADPPAGNADTTGLDRITHYTYDNAGNKASESVLRSYVDAQGQVTVGYVTTTYGYDGENRLTTVTEDGNTITTAYDALGRVASVTGPQVQVLVGNWQSLLESDPTLDLSSPSLYTTASQVVSYRYDALGNRVVQTESSTASTQTVSTYDQYDNLGRVVAEVTLAGDGHPDWTSDQARFMAYDSNGNQVRQWYTLTGDDGSTCTVTTDTVYDADNQQILTTTTRSNAFVPDKAVSTEYNAFGEVVGTGDGVVVSVVAAYDNAGNKITANDAGTGEVHTYGYNLAGQQVSDTVPLSATVGGTVSTIRTLDLDGRVVAEQVPATDAASGENVGTLHATYDRWGNVLSSTDAAGDTTSYTYNQGNQVVTETEAAVAVIGIDGTSVTTTPVKTSAYDADGRLVASTDENGATTKTVFNALGQVVETIDGTGAVSRVGYDALGNEVADENGNGNITFKKVDALGRVVQQGDFELSIAGTSRTLVWQQAYVLDQNGNRLISYDGIGSAYLQSGDTTDAALHANYGGYDSQGRVLWSQDAAQRAASTANTHGSTDPGAWTQTPFNPDFSQGNTGWTVGSGWSTGHFGTGPYGPWTARFTGYTSTGSGSMVNQDRVPVIPGQTITARAWFVVDGEHGGGAVEITWYDANGNSLGGPYDHSIVSAHKGPGESVLTATAPTGAAYAVISVGATNYNIQNSAIYCSGVSWDYVPPVGVTSAGANGSTVVYLSSGNFTLQPTNPDFENGDTGWTKGNGWSIVSGGYNGSGGSAQLNETGSTSADTSTLVNTNRVPVAAGQVISASAMVQQGASDVAQTGAAVQILWYDADGNLISTSTGNYVVDGRHGAWHASNVTATAPAGAAYAAVAVNGWCNSSDPLWVDAVQWNYQYIPQTPSGVVQDSYVYDRDGNLVSQTTADDDTETWAYSAQGQVVTHTDLSGAVYDYAYDPGTGQLTGESDDWSPTAQGQATPDYVTAPITTANGYTDTYDADGQLATRVYTDGSSYSYQYDANGNLTREESTTIDGGNQAVHTVTTTSYDSHHRISHVVETNALTGTVTLDETFGYDAAGNRREVKATSDGTTQDAWYTYDGDNRVVVSAGSLVNGQIVVTDRADTYELSYDADGNVTSRLTVNAAGDTLVQRSVYDARDELVRADYAVDVTTGGAPKGVEETRTYDADGHVLVTNQYYAQGTTLGGVPLHKVNPDDPYGPDEGGVDVGGELSSATVDYYDTVGRLAEEQNFGNPNGWAGSAGTAPSAPGGPNATTYGSLTLTNEVAYQGPNGTSGYDADGDVVAYQYRDASGRVDQYQETYLKKDGYLQSTTSGQNISNTPNVRPSTDASVYDTRGNLVAEAQHTQYAGGSLADTVHVFAYDGNGQIIERRDGTANGTSIDPGSTPGLETQHYVYVAGQQVAHYDDAGTLDVLAEVTAFSSNDGGPGGYVVQAGDTLESIAQAEYGDVSLWYVIAQANALDGDASLSIGQRLTIPTVTTHSNTATTFKPYDPSAIVGSTTPSLPTIAPPPPPPAGGGCSTAEILVIVVTVVVTIVTYGATSELLAGEGAALTTGEAVAAGAVAGAAGSVAGQLTGEAEGIQQGFDWGQVAEGAIGGAIGGGVSAELANSGTALASSTSSNGLSAWGDAVQGAATYAGNDLAAKATDEAAHFSWAGLVASSLSSVVSGELGPTKTDQQIGNQSSNAWDTAEATAAGGVVDKEVSQALGDNHVSSWDQIGENVVGNAIGAPIGHALSTPIDRAIASYQQRQAQSAQDTLADTENTVLANMQAKLGASIWGNNSLPNDGQAALDTAWAGVENNLGNVQEAQGLSEGGYGFGSGADNYPSAGSSSNTAMAYGSGGSTTGAFYSDMPLAGQGGTGVDYFMAPEGSLLGSPAGGSSDVQPISLPGYSSTLETYADGTPYLLDGDNVSDLSPVTVTASAADQLAASLDTSLTVPSLVPGTLPAITLGNSDTDDVRALPAVAESRQQSQTSSAYDFSWMDNFAHGMDATVEQQTGSNGLQVENMRKSFSVDAYDFASSNAPTYINWVASHNDLSYMEKSEMAYEFPGVAQAQMSNEGFEFDAGGYNKLVDASNSAALQAGFINPANSPATFYVATPLDAGRLAASLIPASLRYPNSVTGFISNNPYPVSGSAVSAVNGAYVPMDNDTNTSGMNIATIVVKPSLLSSLTNGFSDATVDYTQGAGATPAGYAPSDFSGPQGLPEDAQMRSESFEAYAGVPDLVAYLGNIVSDTSTLNEEGSAQVHVYYNADSGHYSYTVTQTASSHDGYFQQVVMSGSPLFQQVAQGVVNAH